MRIIIIIAALFLILMGFFINNTVNAEDVDQNVIDQMAAKEFEKWVDFYGVEYSKMNQCQIYCYAQTKSIKQQIEILQSVLSYRGVNWSGYDYNKVSAVNWSKY